MKITINIEKEERKPVEYELDCYWQRSKTEYSLVILKLVVTLLLCTSIIVPLESTAKAEM